MLGEHMYIAPPHSEVIKSLVFQIELRLGKGIQEPGPACDDRFGYLGGIIEATEGDLSGR